MGIKLSNKIIALVHQEFPPESFKEPEQSQLINLTRSASTIKSKLQTFTNNHLFQSTCPASPSSPSPNQEPKIFSNEDLLEHADQLYNESKIKQITLHKQQELKQQELQSMCTFRPEINEIKSREGIAQTSINEKCIKHSMREVHNSVDFECTFMPNFISQERTGEIQVAPVRKTEAREIQKSFDRMQQARTVRQYLQRAFQRSPETIPKSI